MHHPPAAAGVNAAEQRLPDVLTIGAAVLAVAVLTTVTIATGTGSPWRALASGAIFGGWILVGALLVRDGLGPGDAKIAASLRISLGWASWTTLAVGVLASQLAVTAVMLAARSRDPCLAGSDPGPAREDPRQRPARGRGGGQVPVGDSPGPPWWRQPLRDDGVPVTRTAHQPRHPLGEGGWFRRWGVTCWWWQSTRVV